MYEGRYYSVGETITDNGINGLVCGEWGIYAWDDSYEGTLINYLLYIPFHRWEGPSWS